jgi:hypothetical protein
VEHGEDRYSTLKYSLRGMRALADEYRAGRRPYQQWAPTGDTVTRPGEGR